MDNNIKFAELAKDLPSSIHIECRLDDFDEFIEKVWPTHDVYDLNEKIILIHDAIKKHFGSKVESHIFISKPTDNPDGWALMFSIKSSLRPDPFIEKLDSFDISNWDNLPVDFGRYYFTNFDPSIYDFVGITINQNNIG